MIVAGVELLFIPLSDVFMRGAFGIVMHMGLGGYAGVMIGSVIAICGLLSWVQPAHKSFYGIIGAIAAVVSFPASNFGGFFLGMLLGVIGGSLTFGWTDRRRPRSGLRRPARTTSSTATQGAAHSLVLPILLSGILGTSQAAGAMLGDGCLLPTDCTTTGDVNPGEVDATAPTTNRAWGKLAVGWLVQQGHSRRLAERTVTTALDAEKPLTKERSELWKAVRRALGDPPKPLPALPAPPEVKPPGAKLPETKLPEAKLPEAKLPNPKLPEAKLPNPELPNPKLPNPKLPNPKLPDVEPPDVELPNVELPNVELPEGLEVPALPELSEPPFIGPVLPFVGPVLPSEPIPGLATTPDEQEVSPQVEPTAGLAVSAARMVLYAGAANISGFAYQGVADVPLVKGGTVRMMKFTADSFKATDEIRAEITGVRNNSTVITSSTLGFEDDIVFYATKLSAKMMGVQVVLTPDNAQSRLLEVLKTVTPLVPVEMTDMSAQQPVLSAGLMTGALELATE